MFNKITIYIIVTMLAFFVSACSDIEYLGKKNAYHLSATPVNAIPSIPVTTTVVKPEKPFVFSEKQKTTPVLSVTKKEQKTLGSIYLRNSFAADQEDIVFELRREKSNYIASTPFLFNSPHLNSRFALAVDTRSSMSAGVEFRIPLGLSK